MIKHDAGELKAKLAGRRIVASVSGGKDSAAMSLYLTELGLEHERVFMDTKWEHALTYEYLRGPLTKALGPITELQPALGMEQLILKKGMFPSRVRRFCTQELKVRPLFKYLNDRVAGGEDVLNTVGIRAAESRARSQMAEWEWSEGLDCEVWRPIIAWSEQDVIDIHKRHGLAPNPLYLMGASRVGCWPCIYARKDEIRMVADTDPARIDFIRDLEERVTAAMRARVAARGEERTDGFAPSFFGLSVGDTRQCAPIDKVVAWSRTAKGGQNLALFAPGPQDEGCARWGLCESLPPERADCDQ